MAKLTLKTKKLCTKDNIPMCKCGCGGQAGTVTKYQTIEGQGSTLYTTYRTVSKNQAELIPTLKVGDPLCVSSKKRINGVLRMNNPTEYLSNADENSHKKLEEYLGEKITIEDYNNIVVMDTDRKTIKEMIDRGIDWREYTSIYEYESYAEYKDSMTLQEFRETRGTPNVNSVREMIKLGIDYCTYRSVSEYNLFMRVKEQRPDITIEQYREEKVGGFDYKSLYFQKNLKLISYISTGAYDILDYIDKTPFSMNELKVGNDKFKELFEIDNINPELHHFCTKGGKSIHKRKMEPSTLFSKVDASSLDNVEDLLECFGLFIVNSTTHKRFHTLWSDFDLSTASKYDILPFWAKSEKNYKSIVEMLPQLQDISYIDMIKRHTI